MKITATFDELNDGIDILNGVVTDKMANENLKNIIFNIKADGTVNLVAYNTIVCCYTKLANAIVDWQGTEPAETYFQVKSEIAKVLSNYKGMAMTKVSKVEIESGDVNAILSVYEEALDINDIYADKYRNVTQHRIPAPKFASGIRKELENRNLDVEGISLEAPRVKAYLDTLVGTIPADSRDSAGTRIMAVGDTIYTAPQLYFAMMKNTFDETFKDFVLSTSAANFLKNFLTRDNFREDAEEIDEQGNPIFKDMVKFSKVDNGAVVMLKFVNERSVAFVVANTTKNVLDCTPHKTHSDTGIVIDKKYFVDLLKRAPSGDPCALDIKIKADGSAEGTIMSKNWRQPFVILKARLKAEEFEGHNFLKADETGAVLDLNFSLRAELLKQLIFGQSSAFSSKVFLYFEAAGTTGIKMACCDDTQIWQTKINTLTPKRGDMGWDAN